MEAKYPELLEAADYIRKNGLWKETDPDSGGDACLILSLEHVITLENHWNRRGELENIILEAMNFESLRDAYEWNDAPERTAEDVIEVLEQIGKSGSVG